MRILVGIMLLWGFAFSLAAGMAAESRTAIATQETTMVMNGRALATVPPGTSLVILGESANSNEYIAQHTPDGGTKIIGMVPMDVVVLTKGQSAPAAAPKSAFTLDPSQIMNAVDLAELAKSNRREFAKQLKGRRVKVFGSVEKANLVNVQRSSEKQPVITLATKSGLPRVKVRLSPSISRNAEILRHYQYIPSWYYGYWGGKLEFRQAGMNQIQVRASYRSTTSTYNGSSSTYKHRSDWSPIFSPGDSMTIEGIVQGVGMDVEIGGAFLIAPQ